jgi:hypothetical protein
MISCQVNLYDVSVYDFLQTHVHELETEAVPDDTITEYSSVANDVHVIFKTCCTVDICWIDNHQRSSGGNDERDANLWVYVRLDLN